MKEWVNKLRNYYVDTYYLLTMTFIRGKSLSIGLIILKNMQLLSTCLTTSLMDSPSIQSSVFSTTYFDIMKYSRGLPALEKVFSLSSDALVVSICVYNSIILLLMVVRFVGFTHTQKQTKFLKIFNYILSFALNIFNYSMLIPFNVISFDRLTSGTEAASIIPAIFAILLTNSIGLSQNIHDFSYSFELRDYLAKIDSSHNQLEFSFKLFLCILFATGASTSFIITFQAIISFLQATLLVIDLTYYDPQVIKLNVIGKVIHFLNTLLILGIIHLPNVFVDSLIPAILLLCFPFSWKIATLILNLRQQSLHLIEKRTRMSSTFLNLHIRAVYSYTKNLDVYEYTNLRRSVLFESIYENHFDQCIRSECFCSEFERNDGFSRDEIQGHQFRNKFMVMYLIQLFSEQLVRSKKKEQERKEFMLVCFNYLMFLVEVVHVPTSAFVKVVQMTNQEIQMSTLKQAMVFRSIYHRADSVFYNFFNNPTIFNQKLQMNKVLEFDETFSKIQKTLQKSLILFRNLLVTLCSEFVDLHNLYSQVLAISQLKRSTFAGIIKMFDFNPRSKRAFQITQIYSQTLDLTKRKPSSYVKSAELRQRKSYKMFSNKERDFPSIFSQDSCVIYISLVNPIGIIKAASQSTRRVFGYHQDELLNKNCNMLIPEDLKQIHDGILGKFVSSGQMKGIDAGQLNIFGIRKFGFATPLTMRIRLDQTHDNDFGACAFFQESNSISEFMIFSEQGKLCNITKKIFTQVFEQSIPEKDLDQLHKLDIFKMLPILNTRLESIFESDQANIMSEDITTLLIAPISSRALEALTYKKQRQFDSMTDFSKFIERINYFEYVFFNIVFRIGKLSASYKNFKLGFIEVEKIQLIRSMPESTEQLRLLTNEIEKRKQLIKVAQNLFKNTQYISKKSLGVTQQLPYQQMASPVSSIAVIEPVPAKAPSTNQLGGQRKSIIHKNELSTEAAIVSKLIDQPKAEIQYQNINLLQYDHPDISLNASHISSQKLLFTSHELLENRPETNQVMYTTFEQEHEHLSVTLPPFRSAAIFPTTQQNLITDDGVIQIDLNNISQNQEQLLEYNNKKMKSPAGSKHSSEQEPVTRIKASPKRGTVFEEEEDSNNSNSGENNINSDKVHQTKQQVAQQKRNALRAQIKGELNQASSVNSTQSEYHTFKNLLQTALSPNYKNKTMNIFYFIGLLSILFLIILISILYFYLKNQFELELYYYSNIPKGFEIMYLFSTITMETEFFKMQRLQIIPDFSDKNKEAFFDSDYEDLNQSFKSKVNDFENEDADTLFGQDIREQYSSLQFFNERNSSTTLHQRKIYSFIIMAENLYMYSHLNKDTYMRYIQFNQEAIYEIFQDIADLSLSQAKEQVDNIQSLLGLSFVLLELFTLLMTLQLIPIYSYSQVKCEQILRIFCTFSSAKLKAKITEYEIFAQEDILCQSENVIDPLIASNSKILSSIKLKKRTSSATNSLSKINLKLILIAILVFGIFSFYPIVNYIITNSFIGSFETNIIELNKIYQMRGTIPQIFTCHFLRQTGTFEERQQDLLTSLDSQVATTEENQIQALTNLISLLNEEQSSRYNFDLHEKVVTRMLNKEYCQTFQENASKYLPNLSEYTFSQSTCETIRDGLWDNGFLLGLRVVITLFQSMGSLYTENMTSSAFMQKLRDYYTSINGTNLIEVYQYIQIVPELLSNFLIEQSTLYSDQQLAFSLGIYIAAIFLAGISFFILWNKYYQFLENTINNTKDLFGIFPYDFIHENPFISNFVKNEYSS